MLCLIGPVLAARDLNYAWWLWAIEAFGAAVLIGFPALERRTERSGRTPLIDLDLLDDKRFVLGIAATACFFMANISVYLVVTLFLQGGLGWSALAGRQQRRAARAGLRGGVAAWRPPSGGTGCPGA